MSRRLAARFSRAKSGFRAGKALATRGGVHLTKMLRGLAALLVLGLTVPACDDGVDTSDEQNETAATGSFEIFVGADGQYYFQLLAKNGERILDSEGYTSRTGAKNGISSVKSNGTNAARYEVLAADSGEFYFNLKAGNGKVIGKSEMYSSKAAAQQGVDAVMRALESPSTADAATGAGAFETFKGTDGKTYFHLRAKNGQIILQSQGYASKSAATSGISTVKKNGVDASRYDLVAGVNGQFTFRLRAANGKIIARGEMYVSKSNAMRGATAARTLLREMTGASSVTDAAIRTEVETAADGLLFMSESDYPFSFVSAPLTASDHVNEATVRAKLASYVDADPGADKPLSSLVSMSQTWEEWKSAGHNCYDPSDPVAMESCNKMRTLEQVLEANLSDIHVYYFGKNGTNGNVQGIGVSIFIVGRSPEGNLVGVRTLAIWT